MRTDPGSAAELTRFHLVFNSWSVQELEALRSQIQTQSSEINQLKTEKQDLLRKVESGVSIRVQILTRTSMDTDVE